MGHIWGLNRRKSSKYVVNIRGDAFTFANVVTVLIFV